MCHKTIVLPTYCPTITNKLGFRHLYLIIAFECNTKSFAIAILVFFLLLFRLLVVFGRTPQNFFIDFSLFVTQEACEQDWTYFIGHTKKKFD